MIDISLGGHHLVALAERAIYWPSQHTLLLADLHLGKADTFRHFGIAIPHAVQANDIARLNRTLISHRPQRCLILGDFLHGGIINEETSQAWNELVRSLPDVRFELVIGNHDRYFSANNLTMHAVHAIACIEDVLLTHEPMLRTEWPMPSLNWNIHGHIHPVIRLPGSGISYPALALRTPYLSLPAFSEFTAGAIVSTDNDSLWAMLTSENQVIRIR